jgi:hypothetical protein
MPVVLVPVSVRTSAPLSSRIVIFAGDAAIDLRK